MSRQRPKPSLMITGITPTSPMRETHTFRCSRNTDSSITFLPMSQQRNGWRKNYIIGFAGISTTHFFIVLKSKKPVRVLRSTYHRELRGVVFLVFVVIKKKKYFI